MFLVNALQLVGLYDMGSGGGGAETLISKSYIWSETAVSFGAFVQLFPHYEFWLSLLCAPWVGLRSVIVAFPGHTYLLFSSGEYTILIWGS